MSISDLSSALYVFFEVWIVFVFLGFVAYALWPANRAGFEAASRIPLDDDGRQET